MTGASELKKMRFPLPTLTSLKMRFVQDARRLEQPRLNAQSATCKTTDRAGFTLREFLKFLAYQNY